MERTNSLLPKGKGTPWDSYVCGITKDSTWVSEMILSKLEDKYPETFEEAVDLMLSVEREVLLQRHKKYGKDNIKDGGLYGCVIRGGDKLARARNWIKQRFQGKKPALDKEDSLDDTFVDDANYGTIALIYAWGLWDLPMKEDL